MLNAKTFSRESSHWNFRIFFDAWIISLNSMSKINIAFPYYINGIDLKYVEEFHLIALNFTGIVLCRLVHQKSWEITHSFHGMLVCMENRLSI